MGVHGLLMWSSEKKISFMSLCPAETTFTMRAFSPLIFLKVNSRWSLCTLLLTVNWNYLPLALALISSNNKLVNRKCLERAQNYLLNYSSRRNTTMVSSEITPNNSLRNGFQSHLLWPLLLRQPVIRDFKNFLVVRKRKLGQRTHHSSVVDEYVERQLAITKSSNKPPHRIERRKVKLNKL